MPNFQNSFAELPAPFYTRQAATLEASSPDVLMYNDALGQKLGFPQGFGNTNEGLAIFSGQSVPDGAKPLAMVYAGHQFAGWSPQLGDGRALLFGEVIDENGERFDVQLKGSGRTPYSRGGDGLSALGPVIREYLVSEGMHALGVPTTRALAAISTGSQVYRQEGLIPGGIFTRVAKSHIRVGTFQYFAANPNLGDSGDYEHLKTLADYVIRRHYPDALEAENPIKALFLGIAERQAKLIAQWMSFGFIHGVMNTDNMQIAGETIDYGPCAFMEAFHPAQVFSSIDRQGRYAWGRQPTMGSWNLARLAEALMPIWSRTLSDEAIKEDIHEALEVYGKQFNQSFETLLRAKFGLQSEKKNDSSFVDEALGMLAEHKMDFTLFFSRLRRLEDQRHKAAFHSLFPTSEQGEAWLETWNVELSSNGQSPEDAQALMARSNPIYIPRNHRVEEAIQAGLVGDYAPMKALQAVLQNPFEEQHGQEAYELPPKEGEEVLQTFCGT